MYDHSRRTLVIASLAVLATFLDTTILFVAFPDIAATFSGTSASELSRVLNGYTIVLAAMLIPAGKLADRVGYHKVFLAGSTVFTVASMACGLAPTAELLIVFRIVQAGGAAALIPSSLALVVHAYTNARLPRAVAVWGAAGAVAGAIRAKGTSNSPLAGPWPRRFAVRAVPAFEREVEELGGNAQPVPAADDRVVEAVSS